MTDRAWEEYLATARRLDAVRRDAATTAATQAAAVRTAHEELAYVRGRLALQRQNWAAGVTDVPAAPASVGDPTAVLDQLRQARLMVDQADALANATQGPGSGPASWPPRLRNLLVYGPLALFVLIAQMVLLVLASETPLWLPLCGLVMPAAAFGLGFAMIGVIFPAPQGGRVDRTPLLGALVCLASVLVLCGGLAVLALLR
jgi:hypothetical protein